MSAQAIHAEIARLQTLCQSQQWQQVFKKSTQAAKKWPDVWAFPRFAGIAAAEQNRRKIALTHFERAWRLAPDNPDAVQNLALCLIETESPKKALDLLQKVQKRGELPVPLLHLRALALYVQGEFQAAQKVLESIREADPAHVQSALLAIDVLWELRRFQDAADAAQDLAGRHPGFGPARLKLAKSLIGLGQLDEAQSHLLEVHRQGNGETEVLRLLAGLPGLAGADLEGVEAAANRAMTAKELTGSERASACFAAAQIARRQGDGRREMECLSQGHALLKDPTGSAEKQQEALLRQRLSQALPEPVTAPEPDTAVPVFVVGLPRSGTTLLERVLASHSEVEGLGELISVMRWVEHEEPQAAPGMQSESLARDYFARLPGLPDTARAFVDKMPGNYAHLGLIARAFPNAKIVHVERDPRGVALSMWREYFGASGMYFTHDLGWTANEANRYKRYMQHWEQVLPGRIHTVNYEAFVADFEAQAQQLAAYCGLEFEAAMLSPHQAGGGVSTASQLQVRQPVNTQSVAKWRKFESALAPFIKRLDPNLWPDAAG